MISYVFVTILFLLFFLIIKKIEFLNKNLIDKDFKKIQSFHTEAIARVGGILLITTILIIYLLRFFKDENITFLVLMGLINFILGFLDDLKIVVSPIKRFTMIIVTNLLLIVFFNFSIINFEIFILDYLNEIYFFKVLLVLMAIFFIINGSNLIDGFNGLLSIHSTLIFSILLFFNENYISNTYNISIYLKFLILLSIIFTFLNFPKARIFMGDGGAYFLGSQMAIISIFISNNSNIISPIFIAIILSYLFFEIFFSVFRKILEKKSPFFPDRNHLHMLIHDKIKNFTDFSNPITSLIINLFYLILIIPSFLFFDNSNYCFYYFIFLLSIYLITYINLRRAVR
jgi:UDP-N-acetylmuramyl pentapeptide phosphotransferase/UDP-N-acetylglucosamine-1-phosphate transferase